MRPQNTIVQEEDVGLGNSLAGVKRGHLDPLQRGREGMIGTGALPEGSSFFASASLAPAAPVARDEVPPATPSGAPKNVVLLIGDGMGFEQVKAAGMYAHGSPGTLPFEAFPHRAQMTTHSADSPVTDSAAAATALATGRKVSNGVISLANPGGGGELRTLLEHFGDRGRGTGLVTTADVTHATPASFGAHRPSRNDLSGIFADYLTVTRPNVLFGGAGDGVPAASVTESGYALVTDRSGMQALEREAVAMVCGRFGEGHLPYEYDGLGPLPRLSEMTASALGVLCSHVEGFFLMVEGGRIDHAGHDNDIGRNVLETVGFSDAVRVVTDWALGRSDTLVLVTADHETGGLKVLRNNGRGSFPTVSWSTAGHTDARVPVYAWGANARRVSGVMDNTDLFGVCAPRDARSRTRR
jgi:alkaline phosphatase